MTDSWHQWQATLIHQDGSCRCLKAQGKNLPSAMMAINEAKTRQEEVISLVRMTGELHGTTPPAQKSA